ncbi:retrovirus-related pol polyprotein from transposon TNT 1-94 [Tanacetum coccineum]
MFKVKEEQNGRKRYKARLLVKGFQHKRGVDYNEIFSPVVKMTTLKLVLTSWVGRKPRVQIEGNSVRTDSSTEATAPTWQSSTSLSDSWNEEPCRDVHQVGDEREVEVLRNFNWPPSELITKDGVLIKKDVIPSLMILVQNTLYRKSPIPVFEVKQHVSTSVKEIDNVQLGIVNQAELKLFPRVLLQFLYH